MDWLFEGRTVVYVVLLFVLLILFSMWWRDRERRWLLAMGVPLLLIGLYLALDVLVETRRERITMKLQEMAEAVKLRSATKIVVHTSKSFRRGTIDQKVFERKLVEFFQNPLIDELTVWEINVDDEKVNRVTLKAKPRPTPSGAEYFFVRTEWVKDPDGEWRMRGFDVFNPFIDKDMPLEIPGLQ